MSTSTKSCLSALLLSLAGCASYQPLVDTKGVNMANYDQDLSECQAYAEQSSGGAQVAGGTAIGAAAGAVLGRVIGGSDSTAYGARIGAAQGAIAGTGSAVTSKRDVVRNCLTGRGYRVLR